MARYAMCICRGTSTPGEYVSQVDGQGQLKTFNNQALAGLSKARGSLRASQSLVKPQGRALSRSTKHLELRGTSKAEHRDA